MTARRSLNLKLIFSVLAAFLLSLAFSWFLHDRLSEHDAYALIDRTFENVQDELTDCIDERLILVCMAAPTSTTPACSQVPIPTSRWRRVPMPKR